jgi:quercetin dioxygenase-like cupin family protein
MRASSIALRCGAAVVVAALLPQPAFTQGPVASAVAVKWGAGPDFLPRGARLAVLAGDPSKSGVYVLRLRLPNGYRIAPHYHPTDEHVTVLAGTFFVGMGDTAKTRGLTRLTGGGFITAPAKAHHYARAQGVTMLQVSGEGPFEITYVNSADDPRNKK